MSLRAGRLEQAALRLSNVDLGRQQRVVAMRRAMRSSVKCSMWDVPKLPTPWSKILLEKLTVLQLVKKFPAFYGTQRFITALINARHPPLSWASLIQFTTHIPLHEEPPYYYYYPTIYVWVSPVVSFHQVSPPKHSTRLSPLQYVPHAPSISFFSILSPAQY